METIFSTTAAHKKMLQMSEDEISAIHSISLIFKNDNIFDMQSVGDFQVNITELIDFHLRSVPHFHDSEVISENIITLFGNSDDPTVIFEILNIFELFQDRGDRAVRTFVEFLGTLGAELHSGSKPRKDGSQLVPGTREHDGFFNRFGIALRDDQGDTIALLSEDNEAPESNVIPSTDQKETSFQSMDYAKIRIQTLEEQVAKQKRIIEALTDIIKNDI